MASQNPFPLPRERNLILGALLGLSALCWGIVAWQSFSMNSSSMGDSMGAPTGLTMGMSAALFLAIWIAMMVAMMVAMMFPSAAPMVLMFHTICNWQAPARADLCADMGLCVGVSARLDARRRRSLRPRDRA